MGSGSGCVVAAGNEVCGCGVDIGGAGGDIVVVVGVAVATGVGTVAFYTDFFLLDGAGIVFVGWNTW